MVIVPFERVMVVSYRLSIVTIALSVTIRPQFAVVSDAQINRALRQNLWRKGLTDVSQILIRSGRDMRL